MEAYWKDYLEAAKAPGPYALRCLPGSIRDDCDAQAKIKYHLVLSVIEATSFIGRGKDCSEIGWDGLSRKRLLI